MGALVMKLSWATFANCYFNQNGWGIACVASSKIGRVKNLSHFLFFPLAS